MIFTGILRVFFQIGIRIWYFCQERLHVVFPWFGVPRSISPGALPEISTEVPSGITPVDFSIILPEFLLRFLPEFSRH